MRPIDPNDPPLAMLLGTFHFSNPGLDAVKHKVKDVMAEEAQTYLKEVSYSLSKFKPTVVLLEYDQKKDDEINKRYELYRQEKHELQSSEIEQIGFRVAKLSAIDRLHSFDDRGVDWNSEVLFEQLKQEQKLNDRFQRKLKSMVESEQSSHMNYSMRELIIRYNSPEFDRLNKGMYFISNMAGANDNFAGAEASASWWHRNFRMYAKLQKFAQKGARILAIAGQGHTAVMRDFLYNDPTIVSEDILGYI